MIGPKDSIKGKLLESIWLIGIDYARSKGYKFLAACMSNAAFGGGKTKYYYNDSDIYKKISKQPKFQRLINGWIDAYKKDPKIRDFEAVGEGYGLEITKEEDADVYLAIQHFDVYGNIRDDGNLFVTIKDRYDFDEFRLKDFFTLGTLGNDFGYIVQSLTLIDPFDIVIYGYEWAGKVPGGSVENPPTNNEQSRYLESGKCTITEGAIKFRAQPYVGIGNDNPALGQYNYNESVNYDLVVITNDYVWVSWIGDTTETRRYMPITDRKTGENWTKDGSTAVTDKEINRYLEDGLCTITTDAIKFRAKPYVGVGNNNPAIGQYNNKESVYYDLVVITNNYVWVSWIGIDSGERRYMPITDRKTGEKWAYCV